MSGINLEEEAGAPETPAVVDATEEKPSKSDKKKKKMTVVPGKSGSLQEKAQANGTGGNRKEPNKKAAGKKNSATGPRKAKVAKMDADAGKGPKAKEPTVKTAGQTHQGAKAEKKEGSRFEKKPGKQMKTPMKAKKRMGKNKFKKLKKMLEKQEGAVV